MAVKLKVHVDKSETFLSIHNAKCDCMKSNHGKLVFPYASNFVDTCNSYIK